MGRFKPLWDKVQQMRFRLYMNKRTIEIRENVWLGKRYVVRKLLEWELWETHPYDRLEDIKIRWFRLRDIRCE